MMDIAQRKKSTLWKSLLWKDFQQVKSAFLVLVLGCIGVQLLLVLNGWFSGGVDVWIYTVTIATAAPILLALACSGMLIGHERQSGSWAWSSSLPVAWHQSLGSKLLVTTLGSLIASMPLAIIPAVLSMTKALKMPFGNSDEYYSSIATIFLIFLEVIVFSFVATILMRDTLMALISGGMFVFILHIIPSLHRGIRTDFFEMISSSLLPIATIVILGTGISLVALAFRWRWTFGQQSKVTFWRQAIASGLSIDYQDSTFRCINTTAKSPSESFSLLWLSIRNSLGLGLAILVSLLVCSLAAWESPLNMVFLSLVMVGLGVNAFQGDQTLSRFRFLADRGVTPWKLVISRLGVSLLYTLPILIAFAFIIYLYRDFAQVTLIIAGICTCSIAFLLGATASICFRTPVITFVAAILTGVLVLVPYGFFFNLENRFNDFQNPSHSIVLPFLPVASVAFIAAIFWVVRRWQIMDNPKLTKHFLWISCLALLSPICTACTFGFLMIPNVPMSELPVQTAARSYELPDLIFELTPDLFGNLAVVRQHSQSRGGSQDRVSNCALGAVETTLQELRAVQTKPDQLLSAVIKPLLSHFDQLQSGPRRVATLELQDRFNLLIVQTAVLATIAMQEKEVELALRLWKLNRDFQEIASDVYPLYSHAARNCAMYLLLQVKTIDVQQRMGGVDVYQSLIPSRSDERTPSIEESFMNATRYLKMLEKKQKPGLFPPLRWYYERQFTYAHDRQKTFLEKEPKNYLTEGIRVQLERRLFE